MLAEYLLPKGAMRDSGIDWVGAIPQRWTVKKFRYLFAESQERNGETPVGEMLSVSGYRGIEVKIYGDENQKRQDEDLTTYRVVRPGQLVMNPMWLNYAGLGVSKLSGHVSPAYRAFWIAEGYNKAFLHYLLRSEFYVRGYTKFLTGIRPNSLQMSRESLQSFPIITPPPEDQEAIVRFLDRETAKVDELIEKQEQMIRLLGEKRRAVISHAVTKGLDSTVPMRDSGVEWLGHVPAHWRGARLKFSWRVIDCKHITAEFVDDGIPVASIREVQSWTVNLEGAKRTTPSFYEMLIEGGRRPTAGDIIFSRNATVGETAKVTGDHPRFAMGQDVCLLRKLNSKSSTDFLLFVMRSQIIEAQLANFMIGSTFKRVNVEEVKNILLAVPPIEEQQAIADYLSLKVTKIDILISKAVQSIELMKERRVALISAAVTGKIDVGQVA